MRIPIPESYSSVHWPPWKRSPPPLPRRVRWPASKLGSGRRPQPDSFKDNSPDALKTMKADIDRLLAALEPVKPGDEMVFTYVPGTGTIFALNGKEKLTIAGPAFGPVLFSVWLGPKPPNADLKKGMLGQ